MPRRRSVGSSALSGMLWDRILNGSPEEQARKEEAHQMRLIEAKAKAEAEAKAAEQQRLLGDLAMFIQSENPGMSAEEATRTARLYIVQYGKALEQQGALGARAGVQGQQLTNQFNEKTMGDRVAGVGLTNNSMRANTQATELKNDFTRATQPASISADIAANELKSALDRNRIPYAARSVEDEINKARLANISAEEANNKAARENRIGTTTEQSDTIAKLSENAELLRKNAQNADLNSLERARKARDYTVTGEGPANRYRGTVQPSVGAGAFTETLSENPNYKPEDDLLGGSGASPLPPNAVRLQSGMTFAPMNTNGAAVTQAPSAPAIDKTALKAAQDAQAARAVRPSLGGSVINSLPNFKAEIQSLPFELTPRTPAEYRDIYTIDPLTGQLIRK